MATPAVPPPSQQLSPADQEDILRAVIGGTAYSGPHKEIYDNAVSNYKRQPPEKQQALRRQLSTRIRQNMSAERAAAKTVVPHDKWLPPEQVKRYASAREQWAADPRNARRLRHIGRATAYTHNAPLTHAVVCLFLFRKSSESRP